MARCVDPAYRLYNNDGNHKDFYKKSELVEYLKENDKQQIKEINWYKGGGSWTDVTKKYIK